MKAKSLAVGSVPGFEWLSILSLFGVRWTWASADQHILVQQPIRQAPKGHQHTHTYIINTMSFNRNIPLVIAAGVGIMSGFYIWEPMFKKYQRQGQN